LNHRRRNQFYAGVAIVPTLGFAVSAT